MGLAVAAGELSATGMNDATELDPTPCQSNRPRDPNESTSCCSQPFLKPLGRTPRAAPPSASSKHVGFRCRGAQGSDEPVLTGAEEGRAMPHS